MEIIVFQDSYIRNLFILVIFILILLKVKKFNDIRFYKSYINICKNSIKYIYDEPKNNNSPFFSICMAVYNMEKYIDSAILSVLNQSFRNFEIVIVNDYSKDYSAQIIKKLQFDNHQIRLINHNKNLGIYKSRFDAIMNANGNYIIFLDPDDLLSNPKLLYDLYKYNEIYNIDIIEYTVIINEENKNKIYYPLSHRDNHFHNFNEQIIHHPYLSNILFFENNDYSDVFCRCIWNKMVRKDILYKTINFLGKAKKKFNFGEDTIINIINFQLAKNYSNLNIIGYMYNIREDSMSRSNKEKEFNLKIAYNLLFFYKLFYKYIKYFHKDLNYLYFDLRTFDYYFKYIELCNNTYSKKKSIIKFYSMILKQRNISIQFKKYVENFINNFNNCTFL